MTGADRTMALPMPIALWVAERLANCERIAKTKTGKDRDGWLEDARYFRAILAELQAARSRPVSVQ